MHKKSSKIRNSENENKTCSTNMITSETELRRLIMQEMGRLRRESFVQGEKRSPVNPVILDGSNIANYSRSGFPTMAQILIVAQKCLASGYYPITIICDANLRYLLMEHENMMNHNEFTCLFCNAVARQYITLTEDAKVTFLECKPRTAADLEILENASEEGAKIVTNDNYQEYLGTYSILKDKNWQIRFKITVTGNVILKEGN
jgi:hypothetical protein